MSIKSHRRILTRRSGVFVGGLLVLFALAGLAVRARAWRTSATVRTSPAAPTAKLVTLAQPQRRRPIADIESELITITPHGFEPREITRPQGRFLLMVDNRSGLDGIALRLDHESGNRLREARERREELDWSDELDLKPGHYVLSEANHPGWVCKITVTSQ